MEERLKDSQAWAAWAPAEKRRQEPEDLAGTGADGRVAVGGRQDEAGCLSCMQHCGTVLDEGS